MDPLTTAAASGIQARMQALDMLANNLANSSTGGFKVDREFYSTYLAPELAGEAGPTVGESPLVQKNWTDFSQGTLLETGNSTDLALSGKGFFAVNGPNGPLYTRNGSFRISPQGVLVTAEGYPVRLTGGQVLQVSSLDGLQVQSDGQVMQDGNALGQLELVEFKDPSLLTKTAAAFFQNPGPQTGPRAAVATEVYQGKIESSNGASAEGAVRMVTLMRHFEMLEKAIKIGADMNRHAIEEVARVGS